ncbi:reverse transcriptase domain, Reverse transcriptase zinc-binding domain protein [Artemisia annua]|uniref:Reverse transcriptase domain, Reverse transcriptase zinc-binding domain protein n=1 Tax=Artemisia annua TaxID=35608 RepID=A0A2U1MR85_ARTAN|nr:reverse transcriptase domain, Reverse transcriptase zinc-binding domain protein [Artemisia annua]
MLSFGGRLLLIKSVMSNLPVYFFSLYRAPCKVIKYLDRIRMNFFWGGSLEDRKISWISWKDITAPLKEGGVGIGSLDACNISLLAKWWWRWKTEDLALWKQVIHAIHGPIEGETISKVGKGDSVNFWKDDWLGDFNLASMFPRLYTLEIEKDCSLNERLIRNWNWRRDLRSGRETSDFDHLIEVVQNVTLSDLPDSWRWSLEKSGKFTVKYFRSRIEKQIFQSSNHSTRWPGIKASFKPLQLRCFEAVLFTSAWVMWRSLNVEKFKSLEDRKISWISWKDVTAPLKEGGVGIGSLDACNISLLAKWWWRWKTEDLALWKKVIHAIHGPIEGETISKGTWANIKKLDQELQQYNIPLKSLFTRIVGKGDSVNFWKDDWLGDFNLASMFPRLYTLEIEKDCSLNERLIRVGDFQSWNWNWRRDLRSGRETSDFDHLIEVVQDVTLSDLRDSWRWSLEKSGKFTVKYFRSRIEKQIFQSSNHSTRWVKLVPKKVNIMVSRAGRDRLATRINLDSRNIDLHSILCPVCDTKTESMEHLMMYCSWSNVIWNKPRIKASFKPLQLRCFEAVLFTSAWVMWRSRNRKVFTDKSQSSVEVFKEIQQLSYNWISCRCKILSVNWDVWIDNPLEACDADPPSGDGVMGGSDGLRGSAGSLGGSASGVGGSRSGLRGSATGLGGSGNGLRGSGSGEVGSGPLKGHHIPGLSFSPPNKRAFNRYGGVRFATGPSTVRRVNQKVQRGWHTWFGDDANYGSQASVNEDFAASQAIANEAVVASQTELQMPTQDEILSDADPPSGDGVMGGSDGLRGSAGSLGGSASGVGGSRSGLRGSATGLGGSGNGLRGSGSGEVGSGPLKGHHIPGLSFSPPNKRAFNRYGGVRFATGPSTVRRVNQKVQRGWHTWFGDDANYGSQASVNEDFAASQAIANEAVVASQTELQMPTQDEILSQATNEHVQIPQEVQPRNVQFQMPRRLPSQRVLQKKLSKSVHGEGSSANNAMNLD